MIRFRGATLLLALVSAACGTGGESWNATWRAPYAEFDRDLRDEFREARRALDAGELEDAYRILRAARAAHPDNLEIGVWLQETELRLLAAGSSFLPDLAAHERPAPEEALRDHYAQLVFEQPTVAGYVLAARLETDGIAAENLIERAIELDPNCAWAHYGRAHALLRQRFKVDRWRAAQEALERAIAIDPSHLRARRLHGWMAAQQGSLRVAADTIETWLEQTEDDVRVTTAERIEAELDLALIWILSGDVREAKALLRTLEGTQVGRERRLAMLAVAEQELGDQAAALDAGRRAEDAAPGSLLPIVQQALVHQHGLFDDAAAEAQWARVVDEAGEQSDLAAMMQTLRARVELERTEKARVEEAADE